MLYLMTVYTMISEHRNGEEVVVAYTQIFGQPPAGIERNHKNPVSTACPQVKVCARDLLHTQQ
jgi:hypothetical protein